MKLITLNTHSLEEADYERKLHRLADVVLTEGPDILAMQEVNQSAAAGRLEPEKLPGYVRCPGFKGEVRQDNHAARLSGLLREEKMQYFWTWVPAKLGYGKYDEGLAVFSRYPILEADSFRISQCEDYKNWKTRRILGVRTEAGWFYTVHMGWWDDREEPFCRQWERLQEHICAVKSREGQAGRESRPVWLMGDFNSLDKISGEGYDLVSGSGWRDTYLLAQEKDCGITVGKMIDGWRERLSDQDGSQAIRPEGMRIDYIWCSREIPVLSSRVVCNGENYPVVSDHYGVMVVAGDDIDFYREQGRF
ncbi:hypothetical protein D3Z51_07155 [Clostridiaceae bacterium]|nr:hypothetical protein [Clostridiaceae bacterium]RKI15301.1 hypothetical protein D7V81_06645 [bacterium 1XD21-70]